ncbi:SAM-dependent methyltransferase [Pseudonocardia abyssalis]|uniref:Class I SAM-dependent methyltransferase n=1 Tax=Pseudonocardia abyssalis TaxID=2792008 RepID=A0ABS6UNQ6_9PSEU|nr:class I SAM-dependent methyltransferase [Pseudonocardia abyssalis]MBW0117340.1 class I SAM-dependent methyltransferase [Pseudonocardia abyssalis]MBW0133857.1 class I SAM-dependent methyltransferase [Pseudonocardia abyssalis]
MTAGVVETNQHYDLDPAIFEQFLDPMRKYSSALYRTAADDLATAQRHKLRFVADRMSVADGEAVLDIGCGWGALTLFLAGRYDCTVTGVTPARRQHDHVVGTAATRGLTDRVRVHHGMFEDFDAPRGSFAAAAALGSVVHMPDLPAVFAKVRRLLRRGARFYVSESCFRSAAIQAEFDARPGTDFVRDSIFGNGRLRPLSELVAAAEAAGFAVDAVDDLTDHYRRTIDHWIERVAARAPQLDAIRDGTAADLTRYLEIANAGWGYTTKHYGVTLRNAR